MKRRKHGKGMSDAQRKTRQRARQVTMQVMNVPQHEHAPRLLRCVKHGTLSQEAQEWLRNKSTEIMRTTPRNENSMGPCWILAESVGVSVVTEIVHGLLCRVLGSPVNACDIEGLVTSTISQEKRRIG